MGILRPLAFLFVGLTTLVACSPHIKMSSGNRSPETTLHAPHVNSQSLDVESGQALNITLIGTDDENHTLTYSVIDQPSHGTLTGIAPDLVYTSEAFYSGLDVVTFQANDGTHDSNLGIVFINVSSSNHAPVASSLSLTALDGDAVVVTLAGTDADGDTLTYSVVSNPIHGSLTGTAPHLTYRSNIPFTGTDSFIFVVQDGSGASSYGYVTIDLTHQNHPPILEDQEYTLDEGTGIDITLMPSDPDGSTPDMSVQSGPTHGTFSGAGPDFHYDAPFPYGGDDVVVMRVSDGSLDVDVTLTFHVAHYNHAPVAHNQLERLAVNAHHAFTIAPSDIDGDSLTYTVLSAPNYGTITGSYPNFTYNADLNYSGIDKLQYKMRDLGGLESTATVLFAVNTPTVVYLSSTGDDTTGIWDDITHPFATAQGAARAALDAVPSSSNPVTIDVGAGSFGDVVLAEDFGQHISWRGAGLGNSIIGDISVSGRNYTEGTPTGGHNLVITSNGSLQFGTLRSNGGRSLDADAQNAGMIELSAGSHAATIEASGGLAETTGICTSGGSGGYVMIYGLVPGDINVSGGDACAGGGGGGVARIAFGAVVQNIIANAGNGNDGSPGSGGSVEVWGSAQNITANGGTVNFMSSGGGGHVILRNSSVVGDVAVRGADGGTLGAFPAPPGAGGIVRIYPDATHGTIDVSGGDSGAGASGTIYNPLTLYFGNEGAADFHWGTLDNWWTDGAHTQQALRLPTNYDDLVLRGDLDDQAEILTLNSVQGGLPTSDGTFTSQLTVADFGYLTIQGGIWGGASNYYVISHMMDGLFAGTALGDVSFSGSASNAGTVMGNATFSDSSSNNGTIRGNATFNDMSSNFGTVNGTITCNTGSGNCN